MSLSIGIVGLPNVGKSTLFNALTKAEALAANYPFATIEPNVGVVGVPDPRLAALAKLYDSARIVPASGAVHRHRRPGPGASQGQGLGNQFLGPHPRDRRDLPGGPRVRRRRRDPRGRRRRSPEARHRDGRHRADPGRPADAGEGRCPGWRRRRKFAKDPEQLADGRGRGRGASGAGRRARRCSPAPRPPGSTLAALRELHLLTAKPFLYVFNVDEAELADEDLRERPAPRWWRPAEAIFLDAKIEAELAELPTRTRPPSCCAEPGLGEPGLAQLARAGFRALGLQTFLTAGPEGGPGLEIQIGATAPEAAGVIHTDFQRGFIKAEIVSFDDLMAAGSVRRGPRRRQGPHRGQGLRHARRRRRGVPPWCDITTS